MRKALSVARDDAALLKDVAPAKRAAAAAAVEGLKRTLQDFQVLVANKDKQEARSGPGGAGDVRSHCKPPPF